MMNFNTGLPSRKLVEEIKQDIAEKHDIDIRIESGLMDDDFISGLVHYLENLKRHLSVQVNQNWPKRVFFRRIKYKQHFESPVALRKFLAKANGRLAPTNKSELAIDIEQIPNPSDLGNTIQNAQASNIADKIAIGSWCLESESPIRIFNNAFWHYTTPIMRAIGIDDYRDIIKGSVDENMEFVHANAASFWEDVKAARALCTCELSIGEFGVASIDYARDFIDELTRIAAEDGLADYLYDLTFELVDESDTLRKEALEAFAKIGPEDKRQSIASHEILKYKEVSLRFSHVDITDPLQPTLENNRQKHLRFRLTNVADNLEGDKLAIIDGTLQKVETQLTITRGYLSKLASEYSRRYGVTLDIDRLVIDLQHIAQVGSLGFFIDLYRKQFQDQMGEDLKGEDAFFKFLLDLYGNPDNRSDGLKLDRNYVAVDDIDELNDLFRWPILQKLEARLGRKLPNFAQIMVHILNEFNSDVSVHVSNRLIEGVLQLMYLLHPQGVIEINDLLLEDIKEYHQITQRYSKKSGRKLYRTTFKGPAKYHMTVVNWVNGHFLKAIVKTVYPDANVTFNTLERFGKPNMCQMLIRRNI